MNEKEKRIEEEIDDLKEEVEDFKKEKERVRGIVGKIGGMPRFNTKAANITFAVMMVLCLAISIITGGTLRLIMIELAVAILSFKIIYLIHNQGRVNHFQLWILSSLEWRINEIIEELKKDKK